MNHWMNQTPFTGEELYYLRGLLTATDPVHGYAARLSEARGTDQAHQVPGAARGADVPPKTLSQVLLHILERERAELPRWGVDYSDLATKIDGATEAGLRNLYDEVRRSRFAVRCDQPSFTAYEAGVATGL